MNHNKSYSAALDQNSYEKGIKVSEEETAALSISPVDFHGECNYTVRRPKADAK
jgi:Rhodopirellula transposase DDE domain